MTGRVLTDAEVAEMEQRSELWHTEKKGLLHSLTVARAALVRLEAIAQHITEEIVPDPNDPADAIAWSHIGELGEACAQAREALGKTPETNAAYTAKVQSRLRAALGEQP